MRRSSETRLAGISCQHLCRQSWRQALSLLFFSFVHAFLFRSYAPSMAWSTHSTAAASFLCLAEEVSRSCGGLTPCSGAPSRDFCCFAMVACSMQVQVRTRRLPAAILVKEPLSYS